MEKGKKKKNTKKKDNQNVKVGFFKGLRLELKKVSWPSKKEVLKYSAATLVFCIVVVLFFQALNFGLSVVKGVFN